MDIGKPLIRTKKENQLVVVTAAQYSSKLSEAIQTVTLIDESHTNIFRAWAVLYGNPNVIVSDSSQIFISKRPMLPCTYWKLIKLKMRALNL